MHKCLSLAVFGWVSSLTLLIAGCTGATIPTQAPLQTSQPTTVLLPPSATPMPSIPATIPPPTATNPPSATPTITLPPEPTPTPTNTPLPALIVDDFSISMVLVSAGPFMMGHDERAGNERPAHLVILNGFYMDQYEVTNASFAEFLTALGNQIEGHAHWVEANDPDLRVHRLDGVWRADEGYENYPINEVTWFGARAYCQWRGARLPTEAEWEKAARGVDERTYPWGEDISCEKANYAGCYHASVPVDSFPESLSPYGAYNMAGNVMEWVADWYAEDYYAISPAENPAGPENGDFRVFRGGSWINGAGNVRTTFRFPKLPVLTYKSMGFRCAQDITP